MSTEAWFRFSWNNRFELWNNVFFYYYVRGKWRQEEKKWMVLRLANSNQSRRQMISEKFLFFYPEGNSSRQLFICFQWWKFVRFFHLLDSIFTSERSLYYFCIYKYKSALSEVMNENNRIWVRIEYVDRRSVVVNSKHTICISLHYNHTCFSS